MRRSFRVGETTSVTRAAEALEHERARLRLREPAHEDATDRDARLDQLRVPRRRGRGKSSSARRSAAGSSASSGSCRRRRPSPRMRQKAQLSREESRALPGGACAVSVAGRVYGVREVNDLTEDPRVVRDHAVDAGRDDALELGRVVDGPRRAPARRWRACGRTPSASPAGAGASTRPLPPSRPCAGEDAGRRRARPAAPGRRATAAAAGARHRGGLRGT